MEHLHAALAGNAHVFPGVQQGTLSTSCWWFLLPIPLPQSVLDVHRLPAIRIGSTEHPTFITDLDEWYPNSAQ